MSEIKIFVCNTPGREFKQVEDSVYVPVYGGNALHKGNNPTIQGDDTGDNISLKNESYCEETVLYWAWKNVTADYYGFCHYRRYFDFSGANDKKNAFGNVPETYINNRTIEKYALVGDRLKETIESADIVVTDPLDVSTLPEHFKDQYDHYEKASGQLKGKDLDTLQQIIEEKFPEYSQTYKEYIHGKKGYFCNMFIMRKELLNEYCTWLFTILEEFENRADMSDYSVEGFRTPGHLAERLLGVFIEQKKKTVPSLLIKEVPRILFSKPEGQQAIHPLKQERVVPIVFAANDKFSAPLSVALQSITDYASDSYYYDIIILESDISGQNKERLLKVIKDHRNISIRFYNAASLLDGYQLISHDHISIETFYRFLIQDVMPEYTKVLYLDGDLVVRHDVAELFQMDVTDYCIAAALDVDFISCVNGYAYNRMQYAKEILCLDNPYRYFQAGVLLMNLDYMRKMHSMSEWLKLASGNFIYADQDVLNKYCQGHVKFIDQKWNWIFDHEYKRVKEVFRFAPHGIKKEYDEAAKDPYIIHYAGCTKPWGQLPADHYDDFWIEARKTPFYELLLTNLMNNRVWLHESMQHSSFKHKLKNKIKTGIRRTADQILPYGSRRRETLKRMLGRGLK